MGSSDENNSGIFASFGEVGIFREKSVARMNHVHTLFFGERYDARNVEIRAHGAFAFADHVGFISLETMDGQTIFRRIDCDRAETQFGRRAKDADGDFAAVSDQQFTLANRCVGGTHMTGADESEKVTAKQFENQLFLTFDEVGQQVATTLTRFRRQLLFKS